MINLKFYKIVRDIKASLPILPSDLTSNPNRRVTLKVLYTTSRVFKLWKRYYESDENLKRWNKVFLNFVVNSVY